MSLKIIISMIKFHVDNTVESIIRNADMMNKYMECFESSVSTTLINLSTMKKNPSQKLSDEELEMIEKYIIITY